MNKEELEIVKEFLECKTADEKLKSETVNKYIVGDVISKQEALATMTEALEKGNILAA